MNKNYSFTIFQFLVFLNGFSQVILSGQIKNISPSDELKIVYSNNSLDWNDIKRLTVPMDAKGKFKTTLKISKPSLAKISIGDHYSDLFLISNDSLYVTIDLKKFDETILYKGTGSADNNFMAAALIASNSMLENSYTTFKDVDQYLLFEDSLLKAFQVLPASRKTPEFSIELRNYMNSYGRYKFIYPRWKYMQQHHIKHYFDFLKELNLNKPWDANKERYRSNLTTFLAGRNDSKTNYELPDDLTELQMVKIEIRKNFDHRKNLFKDTALDNELTHFLKSHIGDIKDDSIFTKELLSDYQSVCRNPKYRATIEKIYKHALYFRPGQPAPDFTLTNAEGQLVALSSFKGKVVYIDFWATWCGPCLAEMPGSHDLMEKFRNDTNVVFLYVNVRDNKESWKKYLAKENTGGISLYANNAQSDEIQINYEFNSIPRYVLIDKNGLLTSTKAARPTNVEKDILKALE